MMLIIVDSRSKWMYVHATTPRNVSVTIEKLMFELFNKMNGIRHIKVSPHHPASNGLAKRAVQTVKSGINKMEGGNLPSKVTRFLSRYRITPQTTTGI